MKTLIIIAVLFLSAGISMAQSVKPKPIENKFMSMCVGTWISEPYIYENEKWVDHMSIKWSLNNQFLNIYIVSTSESGNEYSALKLLTVDKDGKAKSWNFDDFGIEAVGTEEGKIVNDKLTYSGKSSKYNYTTNVYFEEENRLIAESISSPLNDAQNKMTVKTIFNRK